MAPEIQNLFSVSEVELVYRNRIRPEDRISINNSHAAYSVFLSAWDLNKMDLLEECYVLLLDQAKHCIGISKISSGGVSACIVDPKIVFATALKAKASEMVLAHNHPSGNLMPSKADIRLTQKMVQAGQFLDINFTDHLIMTPLKYYSFADEGLIP